MLAETNPGLDADLLLAGLHGDPVLRLPARGGTDRLTAALHALAEGVLRG